MTIPTTRRPVIDGGTEAPSQSWRPAGRAVAAGLLVLAPALVLASLLVAPRFDDRVARLESLAQDPSRFELASALATLALPLGVGSALALVLLALPRAPRLALAGGSLTVAGVVGKSVVTGIEIMTDGAVSGGIPVADVARVDADLGGAPVVVAAVMFLPCAVLGLALLTLALWRSRAVPLGVVVLLAGMLVFDVGLDRASVGYGCFLAAQTWIAVLVWRGGYLRPQRPRRA